jgi:hypothetical protein
MPQCTTQYGTVILVYITILNMHELKEIYESNFLICPHNLYTNQNCLVKTINAIELQFAIAHRRHNVCLVAGKGMAYYLLQR